jgi:hypothetical protein
MGTFIAFNFKYLLYSMLKAFAAMIQFLATFTGLHLEIPVLNGTAYLLNGV